MAGLTNIKNQALTERIEDHLFQYILDGHLAVGAKLPNEYELADRFGVSRGTIREAAEAAGLRGHQRPCQMVASTLVFGVLKLAG